MSAIKLKPNYVRDILNFAKILEGEIKRLTEMVAAVGP